MIADAPLLDPDRIEELQSVLTESTVCGWLLYDFQDRNPIAQRLLGLRMATRRAFVFFPARGEPVLLYHRIEASSWDGWPWLRQSYAGWRELTERLERILSGMETVAMEVSPAGAVPTIDRVPSGVVEMVEEAGVRVTSSGDLVTAFYARWSAHGLRRHRAAAGIVQSVAMEAFRRAAAAAGTPAPLSERALADWIRGRLREEGLVDQEDCIVAAGANTAAPHYHPGGEGEALSAGSVVLIDLWGRDPDGGIPADQTWMGVLGRSAPDRAVELWTAVRETRDLALEFLRERAGGEVRGWEVDEVARAELDRRGLGRYFLHRLGHSIDTELHGSGPNLDSLETRDDRRLLPGVGFSVEPGVYLPGEIGIRSEVNVHWTEAGPEVTPPEIQSDLLLFPVGP